MLGTGDATIKGISQLTQRRGIEEDIDQVHEM